MESYTLISTPKTPRLYFNGDTGEFEITGRSIPENSLEFYKPLMAWLDEYVKSPQTNTRLTVNLEYFNTSSSKCLVEIFRKLEQILDRSDIRIAWYYEHEDEDMMESGEDFKKIVKVPIDLTVIGE